MSSPVTVRVTHRYSAPAERVFDAWITPSQASRFLFATRTGNIMQCQIDPVVGGDFVVTDRRPTADADESVFDVVHHGTYLEIDRPRRLVFEFGVLAFGDEMTTVALDLQPVTPTACELTLTHTLGPDARGMEDVTRKGWATMLANLERELFPKRVGVHF
jgi:uncharacterized protein YndB with AHSA1/START domain